MRTCVSAELRQKRRHRPASRSATRSMGTAAASVSRADPVTVPAASLIEGASGEGEEHVLERGAADEHRVGPDAVAGDAGQRLVTVRRVQQDPVAQRLDAIAEGTERLERCVLLLGQGGAKLDDLP